LGIIGLITAIIACTYFVGLILSIIGFVLSRRAGIKNNLALAGIVIGVVLLGLSIILQTTGAFTSLLNVGR
jgi:hypothetical protein